MARVGAFVRARLGWLLALIILGAVAAGAAWLWRWRAAQAGQQQAAALRTEVIGRGDLVAAVSATGSIQPERQTNLFFQAAGTVAEVRVESGDRVEAGQLLARLDATPLELAVRQAEDALAVARLNRDKLRAGPAEADIEVARANLRSANARAGDVAGGGSEQEVAIAQIKYDNLYADFKKLNDDYNYIVQYGLDHPQFAAPQETLDALKLNMESAYYTAEIARLQLELAKQGAGKGQTSVAYAQIAQARAVLSQTLAGPPAVQVDQAELAVEQAQTALESAHLRLARARLIAPHAGVVAAVGVRAGEPSTGEGPAVVLLDDSQFHLDVAVDEVDMARLALGQPVTISIEALPAVRLSGRVDAIAPTATNATGLVTYSVRLVLDPTREPLRAGMSATADIVVDVVHGAVLVPNWAIRRDRRTGQAYASLQVAGGVQEVPITTGLRGEAYTVALSGAQAGDVAAISTARDTLDFLNGGG